jgi:hypothetical protein
MLILALRPLGIFLIYLLGSLNLVTLRGALPYA